MSMSLMDAVIKSLSGSYPLHEIVMIRSVVALLPTLIIVHLEGGLGLLGTSRPGLHLVRGLLVAVSNMTFYLALAAMPLAEATAIFFIAPLFITSLSGPMLGEHVGWRRWIAVFVGFVGILIIMRVGTGAVNWASILPVIAALSYALTQITSRRLGVTEKASVMSFYITLTFIVISAGFWLVAGDGSMSGINGPSLEFLFRAWTLPQGNDALIMIMLGFLVALVMYLLSQAYRVARASVIAPFEYVALPLSILWGFLFWREIPDLTALLGIVLIAASGLYVFVRERRTTGPVDKVFGIDHPEKG